MPTTRKKVIKTVYKDEDSEEETGDFSDSGSEAKISEESSSDDADVDEECEQSSGNEFNEKSKRKNKVSVKRKKTQFTKEFLNKLNKQKIDSEENVDVAPVLFTVKDLTDTDKLLPTFLNLSESDSSDDESPKQSSKQPTTVPASSIFDNSDSETEPPTEYRDVWSNNKQDESEDLAKKTFMELEQHKTIVEQTKASLQNYVAKTNYNKESNVTDLLALGEEISPQKSPVNIVKKSKRNRRGSDSDVDDWEEVKESKSIPQQGLQLFVEFPNTSCRKSKTIDVEMMMKRKINRVKKEYQVYMHKVHVLCWLGHGNYISRVLNDQELMAAALAMVPKGCYPEDRLNMKYVEQVTTWYKDKITIKESKNENKFRPKAPPLINTLLDQIKTRVVTSKKYSVYIFVSMLRALGLQCRVMFNFVTLPLKPPSSELCSLSTKPKDAAKSENTKEAGTSQQKDKPVAKSKAKSKCSKKIAQVDGIYDTESSSDSEIENIMQLDGSDDVLLKPTTTRSTRSKNTKTENAKEDEDVSPPKKSKRGTSKTKNTKEDPESSSKVTQEEVNTRSKKGKETSAKEQKDNPKKNLEATKSPQRTRSNKDKLKATYESGDNNKTESKKEVKREKSPARRKPEIKTEQANTSDDPVNIKSPKSLSLKKSTDSKEVSNPPKEKIVRNSSRIAKNNDKSATNTTKNSKELNPPKILVTNVSETQAHVESKFFSQPKGSRKRSNTAVASGSESDKCNEKVTNKKGRTKSAPGTAVEKSKYFNDETANKKPKSNRTRVAKKDEEEELRVSHKDLTRKVKSKNDVTSDLIDIIKTRVKDAKTEAKKGIVKGKLKEESDDNSDYLPEEDPKNRKSDSDDDFKPTKVTPKSSAKKNPKPGPSKKIDRRVLSPDEEIIIKTNKIDIWCEIFVEELEQWIAVDVIRGKIHCPNELYSHATHPVCYVVGWDNNNYLKDLTRRYVPHWNTVTRKQRAESEWWKVALAPWLGPKTAKDREEDEQLDRMQLEAPLPKSIAEYKNHPLYALKRHLLKFEVIYPPDAATLGFVRGEGVYARECVYTCRSRDTWLKEAKVVRLGEQPYKIVKARPKWDKLSNKLITDKPLEVFGPWQVQDYEPPVAENGLVPRNAYGNVELFKECMLPKGTVHIKLPGLNKVAKKLNIDCAPAMTGFDFNGGWSHPVYDGFVVCKEFEEIITEAWVKDQEEQERKELEKIELRVYGNWKKLIKGLLIRERLKLKYGFEEPSTSQSKGKSKGPRLIVKKK